MGSRHNASDSGRLPLIPDPHAGKLVARDRPAKSASAEGLKPPLAGSTVYASGSLPAIYGRTAGGSPGLRASSREERGRAPRSGHSASMDWSGVDEERQEAAGRSPRVEREGVPTLRSSKSRGQMVLIFTGRILRPERSTDRATRLVQVVQLRVGDVMSHVRGNKNSVGLLSHLVPRTEMSRFEIATWSWRG